MNTTGNKKIINLQNKMAEADKKIQYYQDQKKDIKKQISKLRENELYNYVKSLDVTIDELNSDLEIGKMIRQSGLTRSEIDELIGSEKNTEEHNHEN